MCYAPILIPTLCRDEHFIRCIESLKKNTWAKYTDVYVALDYPIKSSHWNGYNKILKYLEEDFTEFHAFHVIKRTYNFGAHNNVADARNKILKKYDRFIYTDDDCEFSPNFLKYINLCLEKYEDDESVLGVTGYSYPVKWEINPEYNAFKSSLIFPMWGTAFWRDKFNKMSCELENDYIAEHVRHNSIKRENMTDARYVDSMNFALNYESILNKSATDVACGCYIQFKHKYVINPVISMVRNYGFDGSGEWCPNTNEEEDSNCHALKYDYRTQNIDTSQDVKLKVCEDYDFEGNRDILNSFDSREEKIIKSCERKIKIQKILGKRIYKFLWEKKHK